MKPIRKAILPVAGLGTRILPATKVVPKEMMPVIDKPALHYVVEEARAAGIEHFIFITGRNKSSIEDYFDHAYELEAKLREQNKLNILDTLTSKLPIAGSASFVRQQSPLGLGHAIWCARDIIGDEAFAILLPDVLIKSKTSCLAQMIDAYETVGGNIIAVDRVAQDHLSSYGIIAPQDHNSLKNKGLEPSERLIDKRLIDKRLIEMSGMVEKPSVADAPSNLKITGRYILQPDIMRLLSNQAAGAGGEIQLTDAMARLMDDQVFYAYEYEGQDYDCGSKYGYFEAVMAYAVDHPEIGEQARTLIKNYKV